MVRYNLTVILSLFYILDYPSFFSYHLELWLIFSLNLLWHYDTMVLHFRIRITKHVTGGFWENIPKSSLKRPKCCIRGNARRPISAVLLVLFVTTIRQTVRCSLYSKASLVKIYAIWITLYPFPTRYNGFLQVFCDFSKKNQIQFSPERGLRFPRLKLISSNECTCRG